MSNMCIMAPIRSNFKGSDLLFKQVLQWTKQPIITPSNICKGRFKPYEKSVSNNQEKVWGNMINKQLFGKQKDTVNWTTTLGEHLVKKVLEQNGENIYKPKVINGYRPDWESDTTIYEVKTRNWTTTGTAGEKVLGVPYKYSDIPRLYGKPLKIICIAYQEYELTHGNTKIFGELSKEKKQLIYLFNKLGISFVKFSDLTNINHSTLRSKGKLDLANRSTRTKYFLRPIQKKHENYLIY